MRKNKRFASFFVLVCVCVFISCLLNVGSVSAAIICMYTSNESGTTTQDESNFYGSILPAVNCNNQYLMKVQFKLTQGGGSGALTGNAYPCVWELAAGSTKPADGSQPIQWGSAFNLAAITSSWDYYNMTFPGTLVLASDTGKEYAIGFYINSDVVNDLGIYCSSLAAWYSTNNGTGFSAGSGGSFIKVYTSNYPNDVVPTPSANPYGFSLFVSGDDYGAGTYVEPAAVGVVDGSNGLNYSRIINLRQTNYDVYAVIGHIQTYMSDAGPALGSGNYTIFATATTSWVENVHQWFDNWFAGGCQDNLYQQLLKDANGFDGGYGSVSGGAFNVPVGAFWSYANDVAYQGITVRVGFVNGTYGYYSYLLSYTKTGAPIYGESPLPTTLPTSVPYPSGTPMITAAPSGASTAAPSMNDLFDSVPLMIQILVIFLLIFVPPLLVVANAPHLGMAGYFVGMALMVGIGLYVGIIPMWFLVLIGLALVVIVYGMLQRS